MVARREGKTTMKVQEKIRLAWISHGPMLTEIRDLDHPELAWCENEIDALAAYCECEGPACDSETCPRFGDDCAQCGARVLSGDGAYLLDGGETYCDACILWEEAPSAEVQS
jgi:hypothetical protein